MLAEKYWDKSPVLPDEPFLMEEQPVNVSASDKERTRAKMAFNVWILDTFISGSLAMGAMSRALYWKERLNGGCIFACCKRKALFGAGKIRKNACA